METPGLETTSVRYFMAILPALIDAAEDGVKARLEQLSVK